MLLGLLRHGEVQGGPCFRGRTDDPLTEAGFRQMQAATDGTRFWDRVISSPLRRCSLFAAHFVRQHDLPLTVDQRLQELDFGVWEGRTAEHIMAEDPLALTRFWEDPDRFTPPEGEALAQFKVRVLDALYDIAHSCPEQKILWVTHGGVVRVLLDFGKVQQDKKLLEIEVKHGALFLLQVDIDPDSDKIAITNRTKVTCR